MATKSFEIYFSDLNSDAQERVCEKFNITPEEANWDMDIAPLAIIEVEEDELD